MYYTVSEMAKKTGMSPHTLRFYAKEGLLPNIERSEGGIRMFKESDFEGLFVINCLKSTGMPIKDIKRFIDLVVQGDESIEERLEMFQNQRERVEEQIAELEAQLAVLRYKCWYYETARQAGTCEAPETMEEEDIPDDIRHVRAKSRAIHSLK